jgi:hypothetical protein
MVKAILDGRKTMTRRVIKNAPGIMLYPQVQDCGVPIPALIEAYKTARVNTCPFGVPGDRLWVRETFFIADWTNAAGKDEVKVLYKADDPGTLTFDPNRGDNWRPSIHMPHWASRITLEITAVRVERVQDISAEDVQAEGIDVVSKLPVFLCSPKKPTHEKLEDLANTIARDLFRPIWDSINAKRGFGWGANPWVWAISFRRIEKETPHDLP